jgi:hypothetical protein
VVVMEAKSKREANLMSLGRLTSGSNANTWPKILLFEKH